MSIHPTTSGPVPTPAEIEAARKAREGAEPFGPEWDAWRTISDRWRHRPLGRTAAPGDLCGSQWPGERPAGHGPQCRRCGQDCTMAGHPNGCPKTPTDWGYFGMPLRPCYCGAILVTIPATFGPCCKDTPPVEIPGGCVYCGRTNVRVNDPDDQPDDDYYRLEVPRNHPELRVYELDFWVHAACIDEFLLSERTNREDMVAERRAKRHLPLGVIDTT